MKLRMMGSKEGVGVSGEEVVDAAQTSARRMMALDLVAHALGTGPRLVFPDLQVCEVATVIWTSSPLRLAPCAADSYSAAAG